MNPREDQLCADTIRTIIQASQNSKSRAASVSVSENTNINKAQIIRDFTKFGISGIVPYQYQYQHKATSEQGSKAAAAPVNKARIIVESFKNRNRR